MTMPTAHTTRVAPIARTLQVAGGVATLGAVLAMLVSPYCASSLHAQIGAIALVSDVGALFLKRGSGGAIPAALIKAALVGFTIFLVATCAAPPIGYAPLVPQGMAQSLLLISVIPSILGAILLRFAR